MIGLTAPHAFGPHVGNRAERRVVGAGLDRRALQLRNLPAWRRIPIRRVQRERDLHRRRSASLAAAAAAVAAAPAGLPGIGTLHLPGPWPANHRRGNMALGKTRLLSRHDRGMRAAVRGDAKLRRVLLRPARIVRPPSFGWRAVTGVRGCWQWILSALHWISHRRAGVLRKSILATET